MRLPIKDLRLKLRELFAAAAGRYQNSAPSGSSNTPEAWDVNANPAFGMWADRSEQDVAQVMERLRAPRNFS